MGYKDYTDESFASVRELEKFYRRGGKLKYDYIIVAGILYTMEEYDFNGQTVVWANKKHNLAIEVSTSNRYGSTGYTDAKVIAYQPHSYRNDIVYAE